MILLTLSKEILTQHERRDTCKLSIVFLSNSYNFLCLKFGLLLLQLVDTNDLLTRLVLNGTGLVADVVIG